MRRTLFPRLRALQPPRATDDDAANVVTLEEAYALEEVWQGPGLRLGAPTVARYLERPRNPERAWPLTISHPAFVRERWEVEAGTRLDVPEVQDTHEGPASRLSVTARATPDGMNYEAEYRTLADRVAPAQMRAHLEALEKMHESVILGIPAPLGAVTREGRAPLTSRTVNLLISLGVLLVAGAWWTGAPRKARRWLHARRTPRADAAPRRPAARQSAAVVDGPHQMEAHLLRERCTSCGGPLEQVGEPAQALTGSDTRPLTILSTRCTRCREPRRLYFDVRLN